MPPLSSAPPYHPGPGFSPYQASTPGSVHRGEQGTPPVSNSSTFGSPKQIPTSSDVSTKSISGLESLVDQIPSLQDNRLAPPEGSYPDSDPGGYRREVPAHSSPGGYSHVTSSPTVGGSTNFSISSLAQSAQSASMDEGMRHYPTPSSDAPSYSPSISSYGTSFSPSYNLMGSSYGGLPPPYPPYGQYSTSGYPPATPPT